MPPDPAPKPAVDPGSGATAHFRALESLYAAAPINQLFESRLTIVAPGVARIEFDLDERHFHAAGAVHGTSYFKMLDDAAFYAANSLVTDRFLLTTAFNLLFTRPLGSGRVIAEGRWINGKRRVHVADARLIDAQGEEAARGTGTFMRSRIPLSDLPGYRLGGGDG
ncbi:PaaI family thioesterase [Sphingomonas oligophenolica]|uniref:PaaI family thioesterase n=1 Tax=Sphingomonas oligophenolica TaxID=301154 RepID=A0A502CQU5_9SPHN|nr:PaaI family thioesterase [Sphingomonas oligophenolica]TPG15597.1 PaaI family thioesterase [Sphingomonas oligophenolica]